MKLEHFALNVGEPLAMSEWYVRHLGLTIVRQKKESPYTTFLADSSGRILVEVYNHPNASVPDYRSMNALLVHLAFVSESPEEDKERLLKAGATFDNEQKPEDGSHLVMLRDPWGLALQLCKRGKAMLAEKEILNS